MHRNGDNHTASKAYATQGSIGAMRLRQPGYAQFASGYRSADYMALDRISPLLSVFMKKRLTYIFSALPLLVLLNNIPFFFGGIWQIVVAGILALALWGVVWMRLYATRRLRPEFAVLFVLPQTLAYIILFAGKEDTAYLLTPMVQNLYFLLWMGTVFTGIKSVAAGPWEMPAKGNKDTLYIVMTVLIIAWGLLSWSSFASILFL